MIICIIDFYYVRYHFDQNNGKNKKKFHFLLINSKNKTSLFTKLRVTNTL